MYHKTKRTLSFTSQQDYNILHMGAIKKLQLKEPFINPTMPDTMVQQYLTTLPASKYLVLHEVLSSP